MSTGIPTIDAAIAARSALKAGRAALLALRTKAGIPPVTDAASARAAAKCPPPIGPIGKEIQDATKALGVLQIADLDAQKAMMAWLASIGAR